MTTSAAATYLPPSTSSTTPGVDVNPSAHLNLVRLAGELAGRAEPRELPNGAQVITFRLAVRTTSSTGAEPGQTKPRCDTIDCVASAAGIGDQVAKYEPGDVIAVTGSLRHRFWRGTSGLNSRYEVEILSQRRYQRQPADHPRPST